MFALNENKNFQKNKSIIRKTRFLLLLLLLLGFLLQAACSPVHDALAVQVVQGGQDLGHHSSGVVLGVPTLQATYMGQATHMEQASHTGQASRMVEPEASKLEAEDR